MIFMIFIYLLVYLFFYLVIYLLTYLFFQLFIRKLYLLEVMLLDSIIKYKKKHYLCAPPNCLFPEGSQCQQRGIFYVSFHFPSI